MHKIAKRVAQKYLRSRVKTAGEVRFVKDNSGDASAWAYNLHGPSSRSINKDFEFNERSLKGLAKCLRSTNASLGHLMSAYSYFAKMKSADLSPDGNLGGKGYIQKISDMRRQYMNTVEALSALADTIYDEVRAPHWARLSRNEEEVREIIEDAEEIRDDPKGWAKEEEAEMDAEHRGGRSKKASVSEKGPYRFLLSRVFSPRTPMQEHTIVYAKSLPDLKSHLLISQLNWVRATTDPDVRFRSANLDNGSYYELVAMRTDNTPFAPESATEVCRILGIE